MPNLWFGSIRKLMKVNLKKTILLYFWLPTWTVYTSLANFLKIWSTCGYWKSQKKHLFLELFIFSISHFGYIYIYIYIYRKKKALGALSWTTHPPTRAVAGNGPTRVGPTRAVAGNGPDDGHGSRGAPFVSCPSRLTCEAPQVQQPLAPSSRLPLLWD